MTARYVGRRTGNTISGIVYWRQNSQTWSGTFSAQLIQADQPAAGPRGTPANPLTPDEAQRLFNDMANQSDLAFRYVIDGCHARSHLMIRRLASRGIQGRKIWAFPQETNEFLSVRTALAPGGNVTWRFHVAASVRVRYSNGDYDMVIDPSIFNRLATATDWGRAQTATRGRMPIMTVVGLGIRPRFPNGQAATGSFDPYTVDPIDVDGAARAMMADYKLREPRASLQLRTSDGLDLASMMPRNSVFSSGFAKLLAI